MFDEFYSYISHTRPTDYDFEPLPLNCGFPMNNKCSGPNEPAIIDPSLYHARIPESAYYQDLLESINIPRFHAQQGQGGAASFESPTESFSHSWSPEQPMDGIIYSSFSTSSCTNIETSAPFDCDQAVIPDLPAGSSSQAFTTAFYQHQNQLDPCFQTPIALKKDPPTPKSNSFTGKASNVRLSRMSRFTPINRPQFHTQQDQGVTSSSFPPRNFSSPQFSRPPMVESSASAPSYENERLYTKSSALDIAPKPEPPFLKYPFPTSKGKISKVQASDLTRLKLCAVKGMMTVEKEDVKCIVGQCPISCPSIKAYKGHLKIVHGIRNSHTSGNMMHCPVSECSKRLQEGSMMRHILTHMDAIRVVCTACLTSFTRTETLRAHIGMKHGGNVS